jgi:hypothetical protein
MNWIKITLISLAAAIVLAGGITFYVWVHGAFKERAQYMKLYQDCMQAPMTIDTIHDSIVMPGEIRYKPVPVMVDIHDTIFVQERTTAYDQKFTNGKVRFRWKAKVIGEIDTIGFSEFTWPKEIITRTKTVDTCILKPPAYKAKLFHWGLYTEILANNFKDFPGVGIGAQMTINDRLTIAAGGMFLDKPYANLRVGVLLK